jgi:putative endonuclease
MSTRKTYFVYLMTNTHNTVLYTGMTGDLPRRVYEHRHKLADGFTSRYNCTKLVYYEALESPIDAIAREKQIKAGSRRKKNELVNGANPDWRDLNGEL